MKGKINATVENREISIDPLHKLGSHDQRKLSATNYRRESGETRGDGYASERQSARTPDEQQREVGTTPRGLTKNMPVRTDPDEGRPSSPQKFDQQTKPKSLAEAIQMQSKPPTNRAGFLPIAMPRPDPPEEFGRDRLLQNGWWTAAATASKVPRVPARH